jgi:hypothetical protein
VDFQEVCLTEPKTESREWLLWGEGDGRWERRYAEDSGHSRKWGLSSETPVTAQALNIRGHLKEAQRYRVSKSRVLTRGPRS